jgi:UDP-glucose 4-epimerase
MNARTRRSIVVGGAGFIGSHLTRALLERGDAVEVIDNLSGGKLEHVPDGAVFHQMDVRDFGAIASVIAGADVVFHLAALPRVQYSIEYPRETHDVNITGTLNVLIAARDGNVGRVVYSGSSSAYGDQETLPLREGMREKPVHPYGLQKYVGEEYTRLFADIYGLSTVTLRYFNVYGPNMDPDGPYALAIGRFLKLRKEGKPLTIVGDGEQTRDFTHVTDVVRANLLAAESAKVGKGEAINIGSGRNISINALAAMIGGPTVNVPPRKESRHTLADIRLAKELLDWEPSVRIEDAIVQLRREWGI